MEAAVHIPSLAWLDGMRSAEMVRQLPILCGGIVVFVIGNLLTYRTAALCFETTDLQLQKGGAAGGAAPLLLYRGDKNATRGGLLLCSPPRVTACICIQEERKR